MELLISLYMNQFLIFLLVLTRVSGLTMVAPLWSSRAIPIRVRAFVSIGIALMITPLFWNTPLTYPGDVVQLSILLASEFTIGLALGLAVTICFAGAELAGQILGQMTGMSLADVASPDFDASVPVFSQLLHIVLLAIFILTGGHHYLFHALYKVFQGMPPGQAHFSQPLLDVLMEITSYSFALGLQLAAPIMVALMLSILTMGLISRTMPQFNVLAVGFSINSIVMLGALLLAFGMIGRVFQDHSFAVIDLLVPVFGNTVP